MVSKHPGKDKRPGKNADLIASAAAMFAAGMRVGEIAKKLKQRAHFIQELRKRQPDLYHQAIKKWAMMTGDPPLSEITSELVARFRNALTKVVKRRTGKPLSSQTIRMYMRHSQILIDKAGPPAKRNRDAAGYIQSSPWARPPRVTFTERTTVSPERLGKVYEAAELMETPSGSHYKPAAWWRALLVLAYNTGLRRRSLFGLRMEHIDWKKSQLTIPPEINKSRRDLTIPLNATVIEHLKAIRGTRDKVFAWPYSQEMFGRYFHKLQRLAGLPPQLHFGLHSLRRTCATLLWQKDPGAAQLMLGHSSLAITRQHYVNVPEALTAAVQSIAQPPAFLGVRSEREEE